MKIDVSKIEGFDAMSAEDKLAALMGYEFEEPKAPDRSPGSCSHPQTADPPGSDPSESPGRTTSFFFPVPKETKYISVSPVATQPFFLMAAGEISPLSRWLRMMAPIPAVKMAAAAVLPVRSVRAAVPMRSGPMRSRKAQRAAGTAYRP